MERSVDVPTGEAVMIHYELAGLGSRFLAVSLDMLAQGLVLFIVFFAFGLSANALSRAVPHAANLTAWLIAALVLLLFVVLIGWFIVFEIWWSGRTPGKRVLGLRVVRDGGFPIDAGAAVIRNLVRLVELLFGFYAISAVSTLISKENKRLGDFAAGTLVVRDRANAPADLEAYLSRPTRSDTGLHEDDRVLIERFLSRRNDFELAVRRELAARIAARVRPTLAANYNNLDDESLLEFLVRPV